MASHPVKSPIVVEQDGRINIRFRGDLLLDNVPLEFHKFQDALKEEMFELPIRPGELYIADNWRMLHGRTALGAGSSSDRHFKRMYAE